MSEYIEREATLHRMKVDIRPPFAVVRDMPAADVVEVVRCKDCIYYEIGKDYEPYCNHVTHGIPYPKDDDFCSYGERKPND